LRSAATRHPCIRDSAAVVMVTRARAGTA